MLGSATIPWVLKGAAIVPRATSGHDVNTQGGWRELAGGLTSMSRRGRTSFLRAGTALGFLVIATAQASAGGFGIREQSAYGQGTSFAGVAAGGALSSMFWNPATMTQVPGIQSETDVSGLLPYRAHTPGLGSALGRSAARQIRQRALSFRRAICHTSSVRTSGSVWRSTRRSASR